MVKPRQGGRGVSEWTSLAVLSAVLGTDSKPCEKEHSWSDFILEQLTLKDNWPHTKQMQVVQGFRISTFPGYLCIESQPLKYPTEIV